MPDASHIGLSPDLGSPSIMVSWHHGRVAASLSVSSIGVSGVSGHTRAHCSSHVSLSGTRRAHGDIFTVLAPKKIVKKAIKVHSTWQLNCSRM